MTFELPVMPNEKGVEFLSVGLFYIYNDTTNEYTGELMPAGNYLEVMPAHMSGSTLFPVCAIDGTERIIKLMYATKLDNCKTELKATSKAVEQLIPIVQEVCCTNGLVLAENN